MSKAINTFRDEYFFLSNFFAAPVAYQGLRFTNSEAAFQAAKCPSRMKEFCSLDPSTAKRLGRRVELRIDWEEARQNLPRTLSWARSCWIPAMPSSLRATLGETGSGASARAPVKTTWAKS